MFIRHIVAPLLVAGLSAGAVGCGTSSPSSPPAANPHDTSSTMVSTSAEAPSSAAATSSRSPASSAPMVAIVTRADWCSVCKANGERAGRVLFASAKDGKIEIVVNDITSDETAARSLRVLEAKGLTDVSAGAAPGTIAFIDPTTRKRVAEITVAHQDDEIRHVVQLAETKLAR